MNLNMIIWEEVVMGYFYSILTKVIIACYWSE